MKSCGIVYASGTFARRCDRAKGHSGPCSGDLRSSVALSQADYERAILRDALFVAKHSARDPFAARCAARVAYSSAVAIVRWYRAAGRLAE